MKKGLLSKVVLLVLTCLGCGSLYAQPANDGCANAAYICSGTPVQGNNYNATTDLGPNASDGAAASGTFCFDVDNTVWFYFNTNASGGNATVSISNINCLAGAADDSDLSAVVVEAGTPCDASTYTTVSNCEVANATAISLSATGLNPNSTYYVVIDGDLNGAGITNAAQCDFSIQVDGPAVNVDITSTTVDENCGSNDGEIDITSVTGGQGPYQYAINGGAFQASSQFTGLAAGSYTVTIQDNAGCVYVIQNQVVVDQTGGPNAGSPVVVDANCDQADGSITLNGAAGGTPPYQYSLNGGAPQASNVFNNLQAGTYIVTIIDDNGCEFDINATVSNTNGPNNVAFGITAPTCGQADGIIDVTVMGGGTAPYSYSLNGGTPQATGNFPGLGAGTYTVTITDANGCVYIMNNMVVTDIIASVTPTISISALPSPACDGEQVTVTASVTDPGNNPNYEWFVNGNSVQSGSNTTYSANNFNSGDVIQVVYTSSDPCIALSTLNSNTITITVLPTTTPTVTTTSSTTEACQGEAVDFVATPTDCSSPTYTWFVDGNPVQTGSDSLFSTANLSNGSQVTVSVECNDPCANPSTATSAPITISITEIAVDAGPDHTIISGQSVVLEGSGNGSPVWVPATDLSNPNSFTPTASPPNTTSYFLTITVDGCTVTDEVIIVVLEPVTPPNAFSPNGDGYNDVWEIPGIERFPDAKISIFTRWGQKIFSSTGYASPWDGTNRGLKLPASTYYYVIQLDQNNKELPDVSGSITILQ